MMRYCSRKSNDAELRARLRGLTHKSRRFGYRGLHVLLKRQGDAVKSSVKNSVSGQFELGGLAESDQDSEQQKPQPCEQATKVVAGSGEHGVDGVAAGVGKVIAAHAVVFLSRMLPMSACICGMTVPSVCPS